MIVNRLNLFLSLGLLKRTLKKMVVLLTGIFQLIQIIKKKILCGL